MRRPHLMAVVLALVLGAGALVSARQFGQGRGRQNDQAEQATLLLTSGERVSGLASPGRGRGTLDRTGFNIEMGNGRTRRIPLLQVALIDFGAGRPADDELASLPATGHLLVLATGSTRPGRLLDFDGNTVRWQPVRGAAMNVPMRDVRRVYLDLNRAYTLAQGTGPWNTPQGTWGRGGGRGSGGYGYDNPNAVTVPADQPWTDAGITVKAGEMLRFETQGRIVTTLNAAQTGPDGAGAAAGNRFPVPNIGVGGLIGKIGSTGRPFAIGSGSELIRMPATGPLMLGVNDDHYPDNSGAFRVAVIR